MNPKTREEWQMAVNAANQFLLLNAAQSFGMIDARPLEIDVRRCAHILDLGKAQGVLPDTPRLLALIDGALDRERHRAQANRPHQPSQF